MDRATLQPAGARAVQAACPWCWARLWPCQSRVQPWGARGASRPAGRMASLQRARERGERAVTGTKPWALAGRQVGRSSERPPPGTREGRGGGDCSGRPQGCRPPVHPGRAVPMKRWSWASRVRAHHNDKIPHDRTPRRVRGPWSIRRIRGLGIRSRGGGCPPGGPRRGAWSSGPMAAGSGSPVRAPSWTRLLGPRPPQPAWPSRPSSPWHRLAALGSRARRLGPLTPLRPSPAASSTRPSRSP